MKASKAIATTSIEIVRVQEATVIERERVNREAVRVRIRVGRMKGVAAVFSATIPHASELFHLPAALGRFFAVRRVARHTLGAQLRARFSSCRHIVGGDSFRNGL